MSKGGHYIWTFFCSCLSGLSADCIQSAGLPLFFISCPFPFQSLTCLSLFHLPLSILWRINLKAEHQMLEISASAFVDILCSLTHNSASFCWQRERGKESCTYFSYGSFCGLQFSVMITSAAVGNQKHTFSLGSAVRLTSFHFSWAAECIFKWEMLRGSTAPQSVCRQQEAGQEYWCAGG